ncbi:MAG: OmpH family outer membrane protein [Desulfobacteraceae bacterium]|nr:MAG: OmpH family outer membrane protein [Desulfobacteraceae bacterium]
MKRKIVLVVVGSFLLNMWIVGASLAQEKVGYINLQKLVSESKIGQKAKAELEALRKKKQADVTRKQQEVTKLRDLLTKGGDKMQPKERAAKQDEFQKANKEYQRMLADARQDIQKEDRELVSSILAQADPILKDVAKKNKFGIILKDPNAIGYLDPALDITDKLIKELNDKAK